VVIGDIHFDEEYAFFKSCENDHLDVAKWLYEISPDIPMKLRDNYVFTVSCTNGHIETSKWLYEIIPNINIHNNNECIAIICYANGYTELLLWLEDLTMYSITRYKYHDDVLYIINPENHIDNYTKTVINGCNIYNYGDPDMDMLEEYMKHLKIAKSAKSY
jgi:hypothetical protein